MQVSNNEVDAGRSDCELRGIVFVTTDLRAAADAAVAQLGVAVGEHDRFLAAVRLTDETFGVGDRFVQLLTPLDDTSRAHRWLQRKGGDSAYLIAVQTNDSDALIQRCNEAGVRVTFDGLFDGNRVVQLHAGDLQVLIEIDHMADPNSWHWPLVQSPTSIISDVAAVDCVVNDAPRIAALIAQVFGLDHDPTSTVVTLGHRSIRFHSGPENGIGAVDFTTTDADRVGEELLLWGTTIRLVA